MPSPSMRVLIAEDYEPFRRFVSSTVQSISKDFLISEVADGQEAVQKARELQPELVLLDIGLPSLNGIEAARQIRKYSPLSKILFVTMESSSEMAEGALATGAAGYIVKADAARELVTAIDAVLRGERYLSNRMARNENLSAFLATPAQSQLPQAEVGKSHCHEIEIYSDDSSLFERFTRFVGSALKSGNAAMVIATEAHRGEFLARLRAYGLDMNSLIEKGRYIALDAPQALCDFMTEGLPDPVRYRKIADELITTTAKSVDGDCARVYAYGECAPLLWEGGNAAAALQVENLWDEIGRVHGVPMLCGYRVDWFQGTDGSEIFAKLCGQHTAVISL